MVCRRVRGGLGKVPSYFNAARGRFPQRSSVGWQWELSGNQGRRLGVSDPRKDDVLG